MLKKIEAIVPAERAEKVRAAVLDAGVEGMTVVEVFGAGRQRGHVNHYRGREYDTHLRAKVKLEIVANASDVDNITRAIIGAARTGTLGDGKIFITEVASALRIRNGNIDEAAI